MNFIAVDVETANNSRSSICQVGIVEFAGGVEVRGWCSLVNPECHFSHWNIAVHGIKQCDVSNSPRFPDVLEEIRQMMENRNVICHSSFDRTAFAGVLSKYAMPELNCNWLDSVRISRMAWPGVQTGYSLKNLASRLGIEFRHHDALEDARAAGTIVLRAIEETGIGIEEWSQRLCSPRQRPRTNSIL